MPKGVKNGNSPIAYDTATTYFLAYLRERIHYEFEHFRSTVPVPTMELNAGLVALLSSERAGTDHQMPMRVQTRQRRSSTQTLEGVEQSHGGSTQHRTNGRKRNETTESEVKPKRKWVFTEARRKAIARVNKIQKAKQKALYKKAGGKAELQKIYQERHDAKKWNMLNPTESPKPIPPLPSEINAA